VYFNTSIFMAEDKTARTINTVWWCW
jgi:hypothetical protein